MRSHILGLADQAIVSGASFLTLVLVSRWTNPGQLGLYSIAMSILISTLAVQYSLVSLPYTIQLHRPLGTPAEHMGASLMHASVLSVASMMLLAGAALAFARPDATGHVLALTWALAATVPFALLREFGRRCAFARLRMREALGLDVVAAAIQLGLLCWWGLAGGMSAASACAAIGVACGLSSIVWLYVSRAEFAIRKAQVLTEARRSWALGKWLLAGQATVSLQCYIMYWLLTLLMGSPSTGVYAACMSIACLANPVMTGLNNALAPRAVVALNEGGRARLRREAVRDAMLLGATMSLFCLVLIFFAEGVMSLLYHGPEFAGQGKIISMQGLGLLASAIGFPASFGLTILERPQAVFWAGSFGVLLTVMIGLGLMTQWGLLGAACGFLAGSVAGAVGLWVAFLASVRQQPSDIDAKIAAFVVQPEARQVDRRPNEKAASSEASRSRRHRVFGSS